MRMDLEHTACTDPASDQPLETLLAHESHERLEAAMDHLTPACREALVLHYQHRLSYRQIGERLRISINSVGPLLARGRSRLKKLLQDA